MTDKYTPSQSPLPADPVAADPIPLIVDLAADSPLPAPMMWSPSGYVIDDTLASLPPAAQATVEPAAQVTADEIELVGFVEKPSYAIGVSPCESRPRPEGLKPRQPLDPSAGARAARIARRVAVFDILAKL